MADVARLDLEPVTPFPLRIFDRLRLPALWVGVGIGLAIFALWLVYTTLRGGGAAQLAGVSGSSGSWLWIAELIQDLFIGFTLALAAASIRGARRDLEALLPHLDVPQGERGRLSRAVFYYPRAALTSIALLVGLAVVVLIVRDPSLWEQRRVPPWTDASMLWLAARNFVNWWVVGLAMALELMLGRSFSRLGGRLAPFDLLEREPLAPFARRALRNVSLWMLLAAFLSLTYLGDAWASDLMPLGIACLGVFALAAFVLPLTGARARVRELKQAELAQVRAALREAREPALAGRAAPGARLADLLAYEARIAGISEWPIDASTLLQLGFYLLIGLGSWVGAAVVERVVDTALG